MGILTDFVIATNREVAALGESHRPADTWPTLESKGVETIKLATLYCAATNTPYSNAIQASFPMVAGNEEEGPWIFRFPDEVQAAIAGIDVSRVPALAVAWASTEELRMDGWTPEEAAQFIGDLRVHAQKAVSTQASLFLWMSL